jgi:protein phosphatase PTC7
MDPELSEDAMFVSSVSLPAPKATASSDADATTLQPYTYLGVADGVGSWREYHVDPRLFSHALMEECRAILQEQQSHVDRPDDPTTATTASSDTPAHATTATTTTIHTSNGNLLPTASTMVIPPAHLMAQAYERVRARNIIGSCTACIALFDSVRHQLHFSNLGDSGLILLRHIDSDVAGSLKRDRLKPRMERQSDLQISFVSQQQLRSFNHPYQLGWTGSDLAEQESTSFKTPAESCNTSLHVRRGDILIMATDGLFDNVELDEISSIVLQWEEEHGFIRHNNMAARQQRWSNGISMAACSAERVMELADALCQKARENSVNNQMDSPFAVRTNYAERCAANCVMWCDGVARE